MKTTGNFQAGAAESCATRTTDQGLAPGCGPLGRVEPSIQSPLAPSPRQHTIEARIALGLPTHMIMSVPADTSQTWRCIGSGREDAESYYRRGIAGGQYPKPAYRIIAQLREPRDSNQ